MALGSTRVRVALGWVTISWVLAGCATEQSVRAEPPLYVDGVRQKPLTVQEAGQLIQHGREAYATCYRNERFNIQDTPLSGYVFRMTIPPDGAQPKVGVLKATQKGQTILRDCLAHALSALKFPIHVGGPVTVDVPIAEAKR